MVKMSDRKFYAVILLLLLIGTKAFSLHHLGHSFEEEEHHCAQCEIAISNDLTPALATVLPELPENPIITDSWMLPAQKEFCQQTFSLWHYSRPPPSTT